MKKHLSVEEFVDALDGTLRESRRRHLETCGVCKQEMNALTSVSREVQTSAPVPEPSPLFWDHFSRRVAEATAVVALSASSRWQAWRLALAFSAMVIVAIVTVVLRTSSPPQVASTGLPSAAAVKIDQPTDDFLAPDESLDFVVQLASNLSFDQLQEATQPTRDVTAAAVDQLTPTQRAAFAKLVKAEMGGLE